jgi:hypothetical protein
VRRVRSEKWIKAKIRWAHSQKKSCIKQGDELGTVFYNGMAEAWDMALRGEEGE